MSIRYNIVNFWKTTISKKKKIIETSTFSTTIIVKNEKIIVSIDDKTIDMKIENNIKKRMQTKNVFIKKNFQNYTKTLISMKNLMMKNLRNLIRTIFIRSHQICAKNATNQKNFFFFNNVFHSHIRSCSKKKSLMKIIQKKISNLFIIKFSISFAMKNELDFRFHQYAIVWFRVTMKSQIKTIVDTKCSMSLIDENYLKNILFNLIISKMSVSINVRDIDNALHECITYVMLNVFLDGTSQIVSIRKQLHKEFHVVKNFKCKILLKMNILNVEQMNINLINKIMTISICKNLVVSIRITFKSNVRIRKIVHSKKKIIISVKSVVKISTYLKKKKFFDNKNYFFESNQTNFTIAFEKIEDFYTHICDCNFSFVQIKNDLLISMTLFKRSRLDTLIEYEKKMLSNKNWISWNSRCLERERTLCLIKKLRSNKSKSEFSKNHLRDQKSSISIKPIFKINHRLIKKTVELKPNRNIIEIKLYNEVTVFEDHENAENFEKLMKKYDSLWKKKIRWSKFSNQFTCRFH